MDTAYAISATLWIVGIALFLVAIIMAVHKARS